MGRPTSTTTTAAVLFSVTLLAAGCSSSKSSGANSGSAGGTSATSSAATSAAGGTTSSAGASSSAAGTAVTATEQEFSITLSSRTFTAGAYTFTVHNAGKYPHNLSIEGPGVDKKTSPTMPGGGTGTLAVKFQKGTYELWCSVDSHKDKGMDIKITVT
jgi:uncharacterized cupredoxin-like copper-binding protein